MPRNADETRAQLIRAAERLFADRGVEAVSLREINRDAGQRNATALQYHFGDRRSLVHAILAKHELAVEASRHALLDEIEADGQRDLRRLSAALVLPAAEKLSDRDGGARLPARRRAAHQPSHSARRPHRAEGRRQQPEPLARHGRARDVSTRRRPASQPLHGAAHHVRRAGAPRREPAAQGRPTLRQSPRRSRDRHPRRPDLGPDPNPARGAREALSDRVEEFAAGTPGWRRILGVGRSPAQSKTAEQRRIINASAAAARPLIRSELERTAPRKDERGTSLARAIQVPSPFSQSNHGFASRHWVGHAMSESDIPTFLAEGFYSKFRSAFEPYLEKAGIEKSVLRDPDALVPLEKHVKLMNLVAEGTGDDCFGLHTGVEIQPSDFGALGFAVANSPTVKAALENLARYLSTYTRGCFFELKMNGAEAYLDFAYTLPELGVVDCRQEAECTLAHVMNFVRVISGEHWSPSKVFFEHPRPSDASEHERIFGAPVEFSCGIHRLVFDAAFLDRPVVTAQARLFTVVEEHLQHVINNQDHEHDLVNQVSNLIVRELSNGVPTLDWVGDKMGLTKRTLQRRLSENGVGFSDIVDSVRCKTAVQYVEKSRLSVTEIASLLAYSHVSAFCRSFRRWTGTTPQTVRAQQGDAAGE